VTVKNKKAASKNKPQYGTASHLLIKGQILKTTQTKPHKTEAWFRSLSRHLAL